MLRQAPLFAFGCGLGWCLLLAGCREEAKPLPSAETAIPSAVASSARSLADREAPARAWFVSRGASIADGPDGRAATFSLELSPGLSADDFEKLGQLTDLRSVSFYRSDITDPDLSRLPDWQHLAWLNLAGTRVTLTDLDLAGKFPELRRLDLQETATG